MEVFLEKSGIPKVPYSLQPNEGQYCQNKGQPHPKSSFLLVLRYNGESEEAQKPGPSVWHKIKFCSSAGSDS